jgi:PAS domain S-box-containing protein
LFDSAHDAIILMDRNTIIDCNERTAELFRCPKERIIGNTTTSFWPERQPDGRLTSEVSLQHIKKALRHERSSNEVRHLRADGTLVDTDVTLNIFKVNGKKYLQAIIRDITERKKAEENLLKTLKELQESKDMLVQSEKLAAIGRLSAGVAHEILNPVNIISMRLQLLEEEEGISAMLEETIRVCQKQIDRIVKITKDISQFSRSSAERVEVCNLNSIVEQTLYLTAPRLNLEKITTEVHVSPDLPCIAIDKYRIEQVLLNLINNAIDAMEDRDKKVLYVSTQQIVSDEERRWARIMVSDTGKGISDGTISKIFDPFFTTKDMGKGTGLGLFICYGIIRDHQGTITARNNEQGGASFIIDLPQSLPATKQ